MKKIYVIGAGIAGLTAALELAKNKNQVIVFEKEDDLFLYASGRNAGILRSYEAHPVLSKIAKRSAVRYLMLDKQYTILKKIGLLIRPHEYDYYSFEKDQTQWPWTELKPTLKEFQLAPGFRFQGEFIKANGVINLPKLLSVLLKMMHAKNIKIVNRARLINVSFQNERISHLNMEFSASTPNIEKIRVEKKDTVIISNGSWAADKSIFPDLKIPKTIPHKRHLYFLVPTKESRLINDIPIVWDETTDSYFRSEKDGILATHADQEPASWDDYNINESQLDIFNEYFINTFPWFRDWEVTQARACLRTFTLDNLPIVGFHPDVKNLFWNVGWGGRGMSLSMGIGEYLSLLFDRGYVKGETEMDNPFSPARF